MIANYEFIDKNPDGDKERVTGSTVQLFNKLSAEEVNLLRDKVNEIIEFVNASVSPLGKGKVDFVLTSDPMTYELLEGQVVYLVVINDVVYRNWAQVDKNLTITGYAPSGGDFTDVVDVYYET